jgi:Pyridine nucleotide-disulphide oxidoreductase, dimerisation domain
VQVEGRASLVRALLFLARLPQRLERCAHLSGEQLRLFPGGEVTAFGEPVVMDQLRVGPLGPAPRRRVELVGEDAHGDRDLDAPGVEEASRWMVRVVPVKARRLAGVALDGRGYIAVNDRLETSAPGVWAIGEAAGSAQFTHVSFDDFRIISANLNGGNRIKRDRLVPYCMFTDPPLARVGLSEAEAQRQGIAVRVAKLPGAAVLRAQTISETRGFMKALVEADGDRILGFTMNGAEAGEVMTVVQTAMLAGMPYTDLRDAIIAHPTMAEALGGLFSNVPAR